uniref:Uncharacterized protein n=1 Tax=Anguilla anguilla TaxID=7936 RepID=A0A0E9VCM9_ANGAN
MWGYFSTIFSMLPPGKGDLSSIFSSK